MILSTVVRNTNNNKQQQQNSPNPQLHPSPPQPSIHQQSANPSPDKCNPTQYAHYCAGDLLQCSGGVCDFFSCADDLDCGELPNTFCNKKFDGCTWPGGEYLTDAQKAYYHRWGEKYGNDTSGGEGHPLM